MKQGKYTMQISMPGFESLQQELVTQPGQPYSYYHRLQPQETELSITVSPSNARIFVDSRLVGVGSYSGRLPIGRYEITAEANNRSAKKESIELVANTPQETSIKLDPPPKSGRNTLLIASALGLGLGGGLTADVFEQGSGITIAAGILTTTMGVGGAYYAIPERTTRGDAWYIIGSTLVGFTEGALVGQALSCKIVSPVASEQEESCDDPVILGASLTGGMVAAAAAALTHKRLKLSTGTVATLGSGAFWGLTSAALFYGVFDTDLRLRDPMLLGGLNLGLVAAAGLLANDEISLRRIAIIDVAGLVGAFGGLGLSGALSSSDEQIKHFTLFGMVTGLVVSTFVTRYLDDPPTNAALALSPTLHTTTDASGKSIMSVGLGTHF